MVWTCHISLFFSILHLASNDTEVSFTDMSHKLSCLCQHDAININSWICALQLMRLRPSIELIVWAITYVKALLHMITPLQTKVSHSCCTKQEEDENNMAKYSKVTNKTKSLPLFRQDAGRHSCSCLITCLQSNRESHLDHVQSYFFVHQPKWSI